MIKYCLKCVWHDQDKQGLSLLALTSWLIFMINLCMYIIGSATLKTLLKILHCLDIFIHTAQSFASCRNRCCYHNLQRILPCGKFRVYCTGGCPHSNHFCCRFRSFKSHPSGSSCFISRGLIVNGEAGRGREREARGGRVAGMGGLEEAIDLPLPAVVPEYWIKKQDSLLLQPRPATFCGRPMSFTGC